MLLDLTCLREVFRVYDTSFGILRCSGLACVCCSITGTLRPICFACTTGGNATLLFRDDSWIRNNSASQEV